MIKTGFCVAYDWHLLKHSLPQVYKDSDKICLALDKDNLSWSGNEYELDRNAFEKMVKEIDSENKIDIYYDSFYKNDLNSRENCNRHRTKIAERLGSGGWHIQVDVDEYFIDFAAFISELVKLHSNPTGNEKPVNLCINLIPIFKKLKKGFLVVDFEQNLPESAPFATNLPDYKYARRNGHFDRLTKHYAIHETWARSEKELRYKLANWGHSSEELSNKNSQEDYINLWISINEENYSDFKNIHPVNASNWPSLKYVEIPTIEELIEYFKPAPKYPLSSFELKMKNNRNVARLKSLFRG